MVITALGEVGVSEVGCANCGPRVEEYLASTNLGRGYPWCAAYVRWCHAQCGIDLQPARAFAAAAKFATAHEVFRKGQIEDYEPLGPGHEWERISEDGDCFTLWYTNLNRIGHVGLIYGEEEKYILTVEGNTSESGSREGTTVKKRKRLKATVHSVNRWING